MDQHRGHAEGIGDQAGVLAGGAAEAVQRVFGDVVAALHRNLLDRVGHVLDGDREEPRGHLLRVLALAGGRGDLCGQGGEPPLDHLRVERLVGVRSEHPREEPRLDAAEHDVAVGHRQRPAAAVAGRARIGAGGLGTDPEPGAVEMEDRAAAGGDGVDAHHRRPHPHPGDLGLEGAFVLAVVVRDVGGGAAHVEADDPAEPGDLGGPHHADDAAGRTRQDAVLALEQPRVGKAAVGLHEHQPDVAQLVGDAVDVAPQDRREIGVDDGGVAARDQLHQRAGPVRRRDLGEADLAGDLRHPPLVGGMAVAVHEHHGDRADAVIERGPQASAGAVLVERCQHLSAGVDPLVDLDHPLVEKLRQDDMALEQLRPVLVADPERVAEAAGDRQHRAVALALEQSVGGDGGAHLDRPDRLRGDAFAGFQAEAVADALDRRVAVALGVLRQQLAGLGGAVRPLGDHVGKSAAPVDPELPAAGARTIIHRPAPRRFSSL